MTSSHFVRGGYMAIWIGGEAQRMSGHSSLVWSSTAYVDDQYASILSMNNSKISTTYTDRSAGFSVRCLVL